MRESTELLVEKGRLPARNSNLGASKYEAAHLELGIQSMATLMPWDSVFNLLSQKHETYCVSETLARDITESPGPRKCNDRTACSVCMFLINLVDFIISVQRTNLRFIYISISCPRVTEPSYITPFDPYRCRASSVGIAMGY
jgi:hypothetical protein